MSGALANRRLVAAVTQAGSYRIYPAYLNASRDIGTNKITVTVRGDENANRDAVGNEAVATFTREEFALFLLDAAKHLTD